MALGDIPLFGMIKDRMHWLTERQRVLSQNVANADTPGYAARDLKEQDFGAVLNEHGPVLKPVRTNAMHIGPGGGAGRAAKVEERPDSETTPAGNSVVLEEQMIKVAETQTDYQMVTGLYSKSLGLLRTALGPRS
ncbi:flagellar basal-body rod protein FlgB [Tepidicaulis marinus]|uniref:Flagellar basal body rod protein FlgB n=2 Tax=Tepidicaulis marinus TaxID=1333998 RepID=A0A081B9K6_9HYPH|nr:flagellar basal-body rod protein FlgB [Tepidicaulis marinus]